MCFATPNSEVAVTDFDTADRVRHEEVHACILMSLVSCTMQPFAMLSLRPLAGRGFLQTHTGISACDDGCDTRQTLGMTNGSSIDLQVVRKPCRSSPLMLKMSSSAHTPS